MKLFKNQKRGFTLIELLVVIAILGILAVGLLVAINPVETTNKSADTAKITTTKQVFDAFNRYYTSKLKMPWCAAAGACTDPVAAVDLNGSTALTNMTGNSDLRSSFTVPAATYYYFGNNTNGTVSVCFQPVSTSVQKDSNTKYTDSKATVDTTSSCKANGGATNCYYCLL